MLELPLVQLVAHLKVVLSVPFLAGIGAMPLGCSCQDPLPKASVPSRRRSFSVAVVSAVIACRQKLQVVGVVVRLVAVPMVYMVAVRDLATVEVFPHNAVKAYTSALVVMPAKVVVLTPEALLAGAHNLRDANVSPGVTMLAGFHVPSSMSNGCSGVHSTSPRFPKPRDITRVCRRTRPALRYLIGTPNGPITHPLGGKASMRTGPDGVATKVSPVKHR